MSLKRSILAALHTSGALGAARLLNRGQFLGATVLLYHRVMPAGTPADHYVRLMGDPTAAQLEALLRYLNRWFRFSTPQACVERWKRGEEVEPYTLLLTFDDGYADMHDELLPVLRRCDVLATVFITTGAISGRPTWFQKFFSAIERTRLRELPAAAGVGPLPLNSPADRVEAIEVVSATQRSLDATAWEEWIERLCDELSWDGLLAGEAMMNWEQVEKLHRSGLVTIGGHTVTHPMLERCDEEQVRRELFDSADELRARLGADSLAFSYPQGGCPSARIQDIVREAGYTCAFTGRNFPNTSRTPLFQLGRRHVPPDDVAKASMLLSGLQAPFRKKTPAASNAKAGAAASGEDAAMTGA